MSLILPMLLFAARGFAQEATALPKPIPVPSDGAVASSKSSDDDTARANHAKSDREAPPDKRVLGVLPNYRTVNETGTYTAISAKQKLIIASKDSFDYPLVLLAGAFAGIGQLTDADESFGQGMKGYGHRLVTNYADQAIGNMLSEGFFPALLHEDPRYRRIGASRGSKKYRTWYAASRVLVTRTDSGGTRFNYSEWAGNAAGVAISNAYHPDGRDWPDNAVKLLTQCGTDAVSQILKEFWPDIKHKMFHQKSAGSD